MTYPWYKKINPLWWFGNEDDGLCGTEWFKTSRCGGKCSVTCVIRWAIRNPLHNFAFYVIGVADHRDRVFVCDYGRSLFSVYPERWLFAYTKIGAIRLPLISYRGDSLEFYFGWRPRGNFGMAIRKANSKQT